MEVKVEAAKGKKRQEKKIKRQKGTSNAKQTFTDDTLTQCVIKGNAQSNARFNGVRESRQTTINRNITDI